MSAVPGELAGRVAFVAGGSGSLGRAVVERLSILGASVAVHHRRSPARAEAVAAALGGPALAVAADCTEPAEVDRAFAEVEAALGPVDILVNCAHPPDDSHPVVAEAPFELLERQLDGVRGHLALVQRAVPGMRAAGFGRIVYVSGALMARPSKGFGLFGAAKAAATTLTRYLALEEGGHGITANIIAPGRILDRDDDSVLDESFEQLADVLRGRLALPDWPDTHEVAAVAALLVGEASGHLTGQTLWVTGGEPIA